MRAYRFDSFESLDELRIREEPDPRPQRGEVLVRVHAVSLNFRDLAILRGAIRARPSRACSRSATRPARWWRWARASGPLRSAIG